MIMTMAKILTRGKKMAAIIEKIQFFSKQSADAFPALYRSIQDYPEEDNPKWEFFKTIVDESWKEL